MVVAPPPPRVLPPQDHVALDAGERAARRFTWLVAACAGPVLLVVACVLAIRLM